MRGKTQRVVFVGGGLAASLAAYRLARRQPRPEMLVLERGASLCGAGEQERTWCLHEGDLASQSLAGHWLAPLVAHRWSGYEVRFPGRSRRLTSGYYALRSGQLAAQVSAALGSAVRYGETVTKLRANGVRLASGEWVPAALVVDARGGAAGWEPGTVAWQKFLGLRLDTGRPHGLERPLLMDASVEQEDGFRFVYVLPFGARELLVEDTYYSDSPTLAAAALRQGVLAYAERLAGGPVTVLGEERGVLPLPLTGATRPGPGPGILGAGAGAGLFHPTTGYSLPEAVRFADWLAAQPTLAGAALAAAGEARADLIWRRGAFCRRLNNMLFLAAKPAERWRVLAQFYRRDPALVARFYGGNLGLGGRLALLAGRPPVPLWRGLKAFFAGEASFA